MADKFITYKIFDAYKEVRAFTSVKQTIEGEISPRYTGNNGSEFELNRLKLAKALGIGVNQLIFPNQTHSSSVVNLCGIPNSPINDTDALVTNQPGICLCVQTADCVPVLLYDPVHNVIAAVHAGWRGTVTLIVKEAIQEMFKQYLSSPPDIIAVIGPSIGPEKYEIGEEVMNAVMSTISYAGNSINKQPTGKFHLNLWEANRQILIDCGVRSNNIEISGHCTFTGKDRFFSARRDGVETGRLVSGIMLEIGQQFKKT